MDKYLQILTKYWGYAKFRPLQDEIIQSVAEGKDTLALMPTGGGKSITFQVPALAQEGICIVITPLIALMKDQVAKLKRLNINAKAIYSGMRRDEIDITLDNCVYSDVKFLYCSPERLATDIFRERVTKMNVNLIAVDEAHCISQWGYDFRPSYLKIVNFRLLLPGVPVLALTATATPGVVNDIQDKLSFEKYNVISKSFERKNLVYVVRHAEDKLKFMLKIMEKVPGTGIVYVRNRKKTREIAEFLKKNKIAADHYHAGLSNESRDAKQQAWIEGKTRVIVATNAFGMGIDKESVRFVIHYDLPDSLEAYFQEAGRAGRDGEKAYAVVVYNNSDKVAADKRLRTNFPDLKIIKEVYHAICNYFQIPVGSGKQQVMDFNMVDFASNYHFDVLTIYNSLKFLEKEGYIELTEELDNPSRVHFVMNRDDLYKFQIANEKYDDFIKLLLRSYPGIFSDFVPVDEDMLAKRAKSSRDKIYENLITLSKLKVISYIPRKKTPYIIFTSERLEQQSITISTAHYQERKNIYLKRLNAVVDYVFSHNKCRSQKLLAYFGESDAKRCGLCDVCQRRNELNISEYEFDVILKQVKDRLKKEQLNDEALIDKIDKIPHEKVIKVIRWLKDNDKIKVMPDLKLKWHES